MTTSKKIKEVPSRQADKKSTTIKPPPKKTTMAKNNLNTSKNWKKNINIEFEDEFINNSLSINNILE